MKQQRAFVAALLVGLGLAGCSDDKPTKSGQFVYPLEVGNTWAYSYEWVLDDRDSQTHDEPMRAVISVTVSRADTLPESRIVYHLTGERVDDEGTVYPFESIYENRADGLYALALWDPAHASYFGRPKLASNIFPEMPGFLDVFPARPSEDSLIWYEPPPQVLKYPIEGRWTYNYVGETKSISKEVTGSQTIRTDAGTFTCKVVEWSYIGFEGMSATEYVSDHGLVKRTYVIRDFLVIDDGQDSDTSDSYTTVVLESVSLGSR